MPEWYEDEPVVEIADDFYMKSFYDLGTERQSGMSLGPIPWSKIVTYAQHYGLDPDVTEAFVDIIRTMDTEYMAYNAEQQAKNKPKKGKT